NVGENGLHVLLDTRIDDPRARNVIAVLGGVGHRPALLGDATLPHEIDDQLELVQHLEVGDLRLVASLNERLETVLDELRRSTAQHGMLAEQDSLSLFSERRLNNAGASTANGLRIRLCGFP